MHTAMETKFVFLVDFHLKWFPEKELSLYVSSYALHNGNTSLQTQANLILFRSMYICIKKCPGLEIHNGFV